MDKKNLLITGAVALAVGLIMLIHGNIRSGSLASSLIRLTGGLPPGGVK